jgi:kumamolisin
MTDSHTKLAGSKRPPPQNGRWVKKVDPKTPVDATITLRGPPLPTPAQMPARALSREKIAQKYGVPEHKIHKVKRVLKSYGLEVLGVTQGGRSLKVRGSAGAMRSAFRPKFAIYKVPGEGRIRARRGWLKIPKELKGIVTGVFGLDQRRMAKCHAQAAARKGKRSPLTPADLEKRYNFPAGDGAGQTIVIAEFGQDLGNGKVLAPAYFPSDVASFCTSQRRSVPNIRIESVGLSPLSKKQYKAYRRQLPKERLSLVNAATNETMMDAEIVAALCPKADIGIYFATWGEGGWVDLLDAVTSGTGPIPVAVSISYGWAEEHANWSPAAVNAINERLQIAALLGITVCVSSGDSGSGCDLTDKRCHVQFPSSSPYVLSVGGTMLAMREGRRVEEVWWVRPGTTTATTLAGSTGGGVSVQNLRAPWQKVHIPSLNPDALDGRVVPDVSALAGPPFYHLLIAGKSKHGAGTSAATPLWASLIARIDAALPRSKRQRFLPRLLYEPRVRRTGFRDIVLGHNNASHPHPGIGYEAKTGFDAVSGWGVPDGRKLLKALATA